jgi:hypothetical protein
VRSGGKSRRDSRADDGLRPAGERSIYFFDPDNNRLQIIAQASVLSDEEKWRRIISSRKEHGRGLSRNPAAKSGPSRVSSSSLAR